MNIRQRRNIQRDRQPVLQAAALLHRFHTAALCKTCTCIHISRRSPRSEKRLWWRSSGTRATRLTPILVLGPGRAHSECKYGCKAPQHSPPWHGPGTCHLPPATCDHIKQYYTAQPKPKLGRLNTTPTTHPRPVVAMISKLLNNKYRSVQDFREKVWFGEDWFGLVCIDGLDQPCFASVEFGLIWFGPQTNKQMIII